VTRPRLTVRVRLTLLYTGLFLACGVIVVAITNGLVAAGLTVTPSGSLRPSEVTDDLLRLCKRAYNERPADVDLRQICETAFQQGVDEGARQQREALLDHLLGYSLATLAAVTLLAALAGWIVAGRVLRPVHRITAAARAASEDHLSARVALTGPRDELRELADTFDAMLTRLEAAFGGQRRFIANASHELRTPLTIMRATVDVVLAKPAPTSSELLRMGRDVRAAVEQAEALIAALLTLAGNERGLVVREPVDLATVVEDVLDAAGTGDRRTHVSLQPAPTTGDPILLERLAANLLDNAVRYNTPGGDVWLATSTVNGLAVLMVANTGPVIAPSAVEGLFEPFRRLNERTGGDGFGLGLAIIASIAAVHGGSVRAQPRTYGGLQVVVELPVATTQVTT